MYGLNVANCGCLLQRPLLEDSGITHMGLFAYRERSTKGVQLGTTNGSSYKAGICVRWCELCCAVQHAFAPAGSMGYPAELPQQLG